MRPFQRCPAAATLVLVAAAMQAAVVWVGGEAFPTSDALDRCGAIVVKTDPARPELSGPFALWDGGWWRLPLNLVHHRSIVSLWLAAVPLMWLGRRIEPRVGSVRTAVVAIAAGLAGVIVGCLCGETGLGLFPCSFGLLGVAGGLRRRDAAFVARVGDRALLAGAAAWASAVAFDRLQIIAFPWATWGAAFVYGWAAGRWGIGRLRAEKAIALPATSPPVVICLPIPPSPPRGGRIAFASMHLLFAPLLFAAIHPVWSGRYLWHRAGQTADDAERAARLAWAVERDAGLVGAWRERIELELRRGDVHAAWRIALEGLSRNRSDESLTKSARDVWSRFETDADRATALDTLTDVLPGEHFAWVRRLRLEPDRPGTERGSSGRDWSDDPRPPEERFALDQLIELPPPLDSPPRVRDGVLPPADPAAPDNAVEGTLL